MTEVERPAWGGRTVVCIASGPSLTADDCAAVQASGHPAIVTNTSFRLAPWADIVFGMDMMWWRQHGKEVQEVCTGRRMSTSHAAKAYGAESLFQVKWMPAALNSGAASIALAVASGASKILLLGYDCQKTGGKTHWHGDHPKTLGNARSIGNWPKHFKSIARLADERGAKVINCSRETALTCFSRSDLMASL